MIDTIVLNVNRILHYPYVTIFSFGILLLVIALYFHQIIQRRRSLLLNLKPTLEKPAKKMTTVITSQDIKAIAGEDMLSTQLDLARAYIELNKKKIAKQILDHVLQHGDSHQQKTATQLLTQL